MYFLIQHLSQEQFLIMLLLNGNLFAETLNYSIFKVGISPTPKSLDNSDILCWKKVHDV